MNFHIKSPIKVPCKSIYRSLLLNPCFAWQKSSWLASFSKRSRSLPLADKTRCVASSGMISGDKMVRCLGAPRLGKFNDNSNRPCEEHGLLPPKDGERIPKSFGVEGLVVYSRVMFKSSQKNGMTISADYKYGTWRAGNIYTIQFRQERLYQPSNMEVEPANMEIEPKWVFKVQQTKEMGRYQDTWPRKGSSCQVTQANMKSSHQRLGFYGKTCKTHLVGQLHVSSVQNWAGHPFQQLVESST